MESSYALPVSAIHNHSHSASSLTYSPTKSSLTANTSRTLRSERSNGSMHSHRHSEHNHYIGHAHERSRNSVHFESDDSNEMSASPPKHHLSHAHQTPHSHAHTQSHDDGHSHHSHTHTHDHSQLEHDHKHGQEHSHSHIHEHEHTHASITEKRSRFTNLLLPFAEKSPLMLSIMLEKDSRRLLYFMSLNFGFMLVQAFYGYVTDSLGLLSDSIHMLFDCLALAMGLFAAVSSKWPPSARFPYGFAKIESLSGFGNGVFLVLISIEIMIEAIERLAEGRETKRLTELLIVSSMGLAVNLVGMMAFGHHHHGHGHSHGGGDCGHDHGHSHSEKHGHDHQSHEHSSSCDHGHGLALNTTSGSVAPSSAHDHGHANENMHGIFLHILADTMGSAAVIVSTLLIQFVGWSGWDPIASCVIAVLIFLSSLPLVSSSAKQLLLTVPADTEYKLRNTLSGVSSLRGVASYSVPKFWMADKADGNADQVMGVIHLIATRASDVEDVREKALEYLSANGMDVVVQVDREGEGKCWCGGDAARTPSTSGSGYR